MRFGNFYLFDTFMIAELNEGIHFDWNMVEEAMIHVEKFYGTNAKIAYISNRVHSYSINPQAWNDVQEKYNIIVAAAIVAYNKMIYLNASLEKQLANTSIRHCFSLIEAIEWAVDLQDPK